MAWNPIVYYCPLRADSVEGSVMRKFDDFFAVDP